LIVAAPASTCTRSNPSNTIVTVPAITVTRALVPPVEPSRES